MDAAAANPLVVVNPTTHVEPGVTPVVTDVADANLLADAKAIVVAADVAAVAADVVVYLVAFVVA